MTYHVDIKADTKIDYTVDSASDYYPYGKALRSYGKERYQSTYHERDIESGFDYRGARFYDSDVARFNSLDPLAADYPEFSDYLYVAGNPLYFTDPDGRTVNTIVKNKDTGETIDIDDGHDFTFTVSDETFQIVSENNDGKALPYAKIDLKESARWYAESIANGLKEYSSENGILGKLIGTFGTDPVAEALEDASNGKFSATKLGAGLIVKKVTGTAKFVDEGLDRVPKGELWLNTVKGTVQKGGTFISKKVKYVRTKFKLLKEKPKTDFSQTSTSRGVPFEPETVKPIAKSKWKYVMDLIGRTGQQADDLSH